MDQIKRAVIAPVNIFQYKHRCPCGREICGRPAGLLPADGAKKARKVLKCPVANLLRVLQSLGNVRLVRKVEAKDLTHEVPRPSGMPNCPGSGAVQQILQAFLKLFPSQGGRIALLDLETRAESVPYQRERKPRHFRRRPPEEQAHLLGQHLQPLFELVQQPRFANACLAQNGNHLRNTAFKRRAKGCLQTLHFPLAANDLCFRSLDAAQSPRQRTWPGSQHPVGRHWLGFALRNQRGNALNVKQTVHMPVSVVRDHHAARSRAAWKPAGQRHGIIGCGAFSGGAGLPERNHSSVDADP